MASPLLNLMVVLMEFIASFISFAVGYYALKAYRAASARGLFSLYWGFIVLGIGSFMRVFTLVYIGVVGRVVEAPRELLGLINLAALIYTVTQLVAYSLFVGTYVFQGRLTGEKAATVGAVAISAAVFPIYRLFFIAWLELIAVTMLAFVAVNTFMNWQVRKSSESALVFFGFGLMLLSHVCLLFLPLEEMLLLYGQMIQLAGFICLLGVLAKVSRPHEQGT